MGKTWELIEAHRASMPYETSVRAIARAAGVGHTTLAKWQEIKRLPDPDHLRAVARQINVPYRVLLEAALEDAGYVDARPERSGGPGHDPAPITDGPANRAEDRGDPRERIANMRSLGMFSEEDRRELLDKLARYEAASEVDEPPADEVGT